MRKLKAIVLGAGYRGRAYAEYAVAPPDQLEIVGVADPEQAESIPAPKYWRDWKDCLEERPEADIVMVTMPDALHHDPAIMALKAGCDVLLMPENFEEAYNGLVKAVKEDGTLDEKRIDDALRRILKVKYKAQINEELAKTN